MTSPYKYLKYKQKYNDLKYVIYDGMEQSSNDTIFKNIIIDAKQRNLTDQFLRNTTGFILLGSGSFGTVYKISDDYVLKIFRNEDDATIEFMNAQMLETCNYFIRGYYCESHYIIYEYIKGNTLKVYMQELSIIQQSNIQDFLNKILYIISILLVAIHSIHEIVNSGFFDLKPENIMIQPNGHIKIIDLGSVMTINSSTPTSPTFAYASPKNPTSASTNNDMWSIGCILFELLISFY
jgi:serine/threonine protein kinase